MDKVTSEGFVSLGFALVDEETDRRIFSLSRNSASPFTIGSLDFFLYEWGETVGQFYDSRGLTMIRNARTMDDIRTAVEKWTKIMEDV